MEIEDVRCFLKLCEVGSFTKAAAQCGVSQSTLSRAIKGLETTLGGEPLVVRDAGPIRPTEFGQLMRPYFERAFAELDQAETKSRAILGLIEADLSVGMMCTIGPTRMIDFFAQFHRRYPGIDMTLLDGNVDHLEELLLAGELDVAICCRPDEAIEKFHSASLFDEGFVVAMAPGHRLTQQDVVRVPDLAGERYLSRVNCEYSDVLVNLRKSFEGVVLHKKYSSERDDWIQSMVMAGLGITYIPEYAATLEGLETRRLVDPQVFRTIKVSTVRGRQHSPAVGAFVAAAQAYRWSELGPLKNIGVRDADLWNEISME